MKTLRYRIGNEVKPGILDQEGNIRDVSSLVKDWDNKNLTISKLNEVKKINPASLPLVENSDGYAPCVCKESIGKFICIGLNYSDHAEETGQKVPPEPIIFAKFLRLIFFISPLFTIYLKVVRNNLQLI